MNPVSTNPEGNRMKDDWFAASWPLLIALAAAIVVVCVLGLPPDAPHPHGQRVDAWLNTPPSLRGPFPERGQ